MYGNNNCTIDFLSLKNNLIHKTDLTTHFGIEITLKKSVMNGLSSFIN